MYRLCVSVCQSGGGSPQSQRPAELSDDEVGELFQRLAEVQQEKWMLEEKVRRLLCYHGNRVSDHHNVGGVLGSASRQSGHQ